MKLAKSLLLGSAAGLCAVAGAQAADLPMRKAAPVEYVRVCTAYGAGFFYIPGTDTCLRVGGRARFEYHYSMQRTRNSDQSGFRAFGRLNIDARTQTAYGTLRTFVRFDLQSRTGAYLKSGTQERYANAFFGTGPDTRNSAQKYVELDKAFIQFAGFTAGRAASFYDFYAHDVEMIGASIGSDAASTNLLAYTATFGGGFSATLSVEDPIFRRNPVFGTGFNGNVTGATPNVTPIILFNGAGAPVGLGNLDVGQRNVMPDFVGVLRYDAAWGSAQVSAAVHEIRTGAYNAVALAGGVPANSGFGVVPGAEYGYAVQGGLKLNVPQLAPGDVLWLQAAYGKGAGDYTGIFSPQGRELTGVTYTNRFAGLNGFGGYDMAYDLGGRAHLTESWTGTVAFTHYWTPEIRTSVFGSYGRVTYDRALRGIGSPNIGPFLTAAAFANPSAAGGLFSGFGRDFSNLYAGGNIIWSPIKDFDVGTELVYQRLEFLGGASGGRVVDANKNQTIGGVARTIKFDDQFIVRMRIQRDF